jgi:superfamily II DNA/RNA helicase
VLLIGGTATERQIEKLKSKPHVVVGSPGRIVELIERGKLKTTYLRAIVVDEADRLLQDESLKWIQKIVGLAPPTRLTSPGNPLNQQCPQRSHLIGCASPLRIATGQR